MDGKQVMRNTNNHPPNRKEKEKFAKRKTLKKM